MGLVGAHAKEKCVQSFVWKPHEEGTQLEDLGVDGSVIKIAVKVIGF